MAKTKAEINRAIILLVLVMFAALWVLINSGELVLAGIVYIAIPMVSIFLYRNWEFFGRKGKLEGIEGDWIKDAFIGVAAASGLILLSKFIPGIGSIGLPNVQSIAGTVGRFLIIVIAAPIGEELIFRDIFQDFFESKLKLGFFISAVIVSISFALYHLVAYGESLSAAQGSFITAGIAGLGFTYLNKFTNSNASNIAAHMVLNLWLGFIKLGVIIG